MLLSTSIICLASVIYFEARNQPTAGQLAVAHVVMNRADARQKSICSVVKEPYQFSWYQGQSKIRPTEKDAWENSIAIAKRVLFAEESDPTGGSHYFWHHTIQPKWSKRCKVKQRIGSHNFCKFR